MIELYTSDALRTILPFLIFGFSLGFFYDLFSALRITFKNRVVLFLSDFIFCVLTALSFYLLLIGYLSGEFRFFAFVFSAVGVFLYYLLLKGFVRKVFLFLLKGIKKIIAFLLSPIFSLIKRVKIGKKIKNILKKLLKCIYEVMYNRFVKIKFKGRGRNASKKTEKEDIEKYFA